MIVPKQGGDCAKPSFFMKICCHVYVFSVTSAFMPMRGRLQPTALLMTCLHLSKSSAAVNRFIAENDVTLSSLGTNENDSMPLGNGDRAANVWTEQMAMLSCSWPKPTPGAKWAISSNWDVFASKSRPIRLLTPRASARCLAWKGRN